MVLLVKKPEQNPQEPDIGALGPDLHTPTQYNTVTYFPFPPVGPTSHKYPPRDPRFPPYEQQLALGRRANTRDIHI